MSEFDAGSGYKSEEEEEFEKALNLDDKEKEIAREIDAVFSKSVSEFTFWMREHGAKPKETKYAFEATLTGETHAHFMWMYLCTVKTSIYSRSELIGKIIEAGIREVYEEEQMGMVQAAIAKQTLVKHMPPEIARLKYIEGYRAMIQRRKDVEQKNLKDSLGG